MVEDRKTLSSEKDDANSLNGEARHKSISRYGRPNIKRLISKLPKYIPGHLCLFEQGGVVKNNLEMCTLTFNSNRGGNYGDL